MKYVGYAFFGVLMVALWLNLTPSGKTAKRHYMAQGHDYYAN
ncbi:hypothetical protein ACOYW6_12100 [Parablastomonas sp. CN1-191]